MGPNWVGFTKIESTTLPFGPAVRLACRINEAWPACNAPMVGTKTMGDGAILHQAVAALICAAVFTPLYLAGEETGAGAFKSCF